MTKKVKLVNVVQVMLFRRILPCQRRDFNLWEFDPAQHQTLSRLFETKHEDAWKVLFKSSEVSHPVTEDRGFCAKRQASEDWKRTSGQSDCPAPLPEGPADARLAELLIPAPHVVPKKKAKEKATGTRKSSRRPVVSDSSPDNPDAPSALEDEEEEGEEEASPPPTGGGKKRKAAPTGEAGGSKKGKTHLSDYASEPKTAGRNGHPGSSPWQSLRPEVSSVICRAAP